MYLGILQINGQDYDPAASYSQPLAGAPYIIAATLPGAYRDITSIENYYTYINEVSQDFKYVRDQIKQIVLDAGSGDEDTGFNTLTNPQKQICCELLIGSHAARLGFLGSHNTMVLLGLAYHKQASEARNIRFAYAIQEAHTRLPDNAKEIPGEVSTQIIDFIYFGIEGTQEGDPEGLMDYLYGRAGTTWDAAGLINKPWTPDGITLTQLVNNLYDILHKGEY